MIEFTTADINRVLNEYSEYINSLKEEVSLLDVDGINISFTQGEEYDLDEIVFNRSRINDESEISIRVNNVRDFAILYAAIENMRLWTINGEQIVAPNRIPRMNVKIRRFILKNMDEIKKERSFTYSFKDLIRDDRELIDLESPDKTDLRKNAKTGSIYFDDVGTLSVANQAYESIYGIKREINEGSSMMKRYIVNWNEMDEYMADNVPEDSFKFYRSYIDKLRWNDEEDYLDFEDAYAILKECLEINLEPDDYGFD